MLPTRRRSPPSYSRLESTPESSSPNGDWNVRIDGSDASGNSWTTTSTQMDGPRSSAFDRSGGNIYGDLEKAGVSDSWPTTAAGLRRHARTVRGKAVLATAAVALFLFARSAWHSGIPSPPSNPNLKQDVLATANGRTASTATLTASSAAQAVPIAKTIPEYDEAAFTQPRRPVSPTWPDPWAHVDDPAFRAREWLGVSRFGSAEQGWKQTQDPPKRAVPPARYILKAFEYTAEVAGRRKDGLAGEGPLPPGVDFDDMTGRPKMVDRKKLKLGKEHGWKPDPRFLAANIGTAKQNVRESPPIQHISARASSRDPALVEEARRRDWVKRAFMHVWEGYSQNAYGHDELAPVSGKWSDNYNGWGATLVDSLDTLLMMNMSHEYTVARQHVADIDFTFLVPKGAETFSTKLPDLDDLELASEGKGGKADSQRVKGFVDPRRLQQQNQHSPTTISWFETTIRYLGGLLSAYELSADPLLLQRATELGDWLLPAFATEYGLPINRYTIGHNPDGAHSGRQSLAEVGSMTLEMTKLSQLTGDEVYYRAAQRAIDTLDKHFPAAQKAPEAAVAPGTRRKGRLGTLLPAFLDANYPANMQGDYTLGGLADSYYEYLVKQAHLTSLSLDQYSRMYSRAMDSILEHLVRPLDVIPGRHDLALLGNLNWGGYQHEMQHLACFAGGMFGLGAKLLDRPRDLEVGVNVTNACVWAYESTQTGIGGESVTFYGPDERARFIINEGTDGSITEITPRGNPPGVRTANKRQIGRPETIESVFYMYRLTGDRKWQDQGWTMFVNWVEHTITEFGFATVRDVTTVPVRKEDSMESFVLGETLKYYYLLFSPPDFFSLDDWVFSTEAHPFWRPRPDARHPPGTLWAGPDSAPEASAAFSSQMGEGTWVQRWARVQQAAALAPITSPRSPEEKARAASLRESRARLDPEMRQFGRRPPGGARRPFVRPTEEDMAEAKRRQEEHQKYNPPPKLAQPPAGQRANGGGRGMAGGGF